MTVARYASFQELEECMAILLGCTNYNVVITHLKVLWLQNPGMYLFAAILVLRRNPVFLLRNDLLYLAFTHTCDRLNDSAVHPHLSGTGD